MAARSSSTDELRIMAAELIEGERESHRKEREGMRQVLDYLAGNIAHLGEHLTRTARRCEDLERQLAEEHDAGDAALKVTWDAAEDSTLHRLGLPSPRQEITPRHRRGHLRGAYGILIVAMLGLSVFRPHPHVVHVARRNPALTASSLASVHGRASMVAVSATGW